MNEEKGKRKRKNPAHEVEQPLQPQGPAAGEEDSSREQVGQGWMVEMEALQKELEQSRQQAQEYFDGWQRERADFSNYKRRVEREQSQQVQTITGQVIRKYLVVLDDLERALKVRPSQGEGASWSEGVELIYRKLQTILENEGVKRIPADNQFFDPHFHEAISHEDCTGYQSGQIIEVLQQGYAIGERVLRPALVRVAQ